MPLPDMTSGTRTLHRQSRVLARFKSDNASVPEQGPNQGTDESTRVERRLGSLQFVNRVPGIGVVQEPSVFPLAPTGVTNLTSTFLDVVDNAERIRLTWTADPTATTYEVIVQFQGAQATEIQNNSVIISLPNWTSNDPDVMTGIRSVNSAGSFTVYLSVGCFLAGSPVSLADGSIKPIEEVAIGDLVVGAFGEINTVIALQHTYVGSSTMYKINGEHDTTDHHPHVSPDKQFYTPEPAIIDGDVYGKSHAVIGPDGPTTMKLHGLAKGRVQTLKLGQPLKTIEGSRVVNTLEAYNLPPETPLYNLVVGGSHTYHVNGYAVTGWPREDDFDYDAWALR